MLPVSVELKRKLASLNEALKQAFPLQSLDESKVRKRLGEVGVFHTIDKWNGEEIKGFLQERFLVGVDGSVNSTKGSQIRTLSVFQALAKATNGKEKWAADVYTPLLKEEDGEEESAAREARKRGNLLSRLEIEVTMEAVKDWAPRVVMLDGSLLHFYFSDSKSWEQLVETAESQNTFLVGVSEEIETRTLVQTFFPEYPALTDRELLYGVLKEGEAFEWEAWSPSGSRLWKMAFRTSKSPQPIGLDGLKSQREERWNLAKLVYSLTPEQGRGIPYWLDIVDNQVRVTDPLVETMVEQYIDPELRYRLLKSKRNERMI